MSNRKMILVAVVSGIFVTACVAFAQTAVAEPLLDLGDATAIDESANSSATGGASTPLDESKIESASENGGGAASMKIKNSNETSNESAASKKIKIRDGPLNGSTNEPTAHTAKTKPNKKNANKAATTALDETRFKTSGVIEVGIDVINRLNRNTKEDATEVRPIARGEIELSARPIKGVRADMGVEYNQRDTFITIDKFYVRYEAWDRGELRAGIMKKAFGLEERAGLDERYFRSRSIINDSLESLGFLNHDLTLQYRHNLGKVWRLVGGMSMSASAADAHTKSTDTLHFFQNYSVHYSKDSIDIIAAAIVQHFVPREWYTTAFAASLSFRYAAKVWISESELTFGTNIAEKIHRDKDAVILGARTQEQLPINIGLKTLRQIIPIAEAAMYWNVLENGNDFDAQIRAGVTLCFAKNNALQFRNAFGTIIRSRDGKADVRRYRFDSEAAVIF